MPEPDEAQQEGAPRQRANTNPTARALAEGLAVQLTDLESKVDELSKVVGDYQQDHIRETVATHRNAISDLRDELTGFQNGITRQVEKLRAAVAAVGPVMDGAVGAMVSTGPSLEEIADQVAAVVKPEQDRVAAKLSEMLARLDGAERRVAEVEQRPQGFAPPQVLAGDLDKLWERVRGLEETLGDAAKAVEHLPGPEDLVSRLEAVERRLSTVGAIQPEGWGVARGPIHYPIMDKVREPVGGVHQKVLDLMRKVEAIGKDRTADQGAGGRFKFRGIDEAMDAVGHAMREVGLTMETEVLDKDYAHNPVTNTYTDRNTGEKSQRTVLWTTAMVTYRYIFVDPVDGSRHTFEMAGEGRDASDKGTSKAGSMALKYGLFQALMIPVSGLDDSDTESPQVQQDRPAPARQGGEPATPPARPADQAKPPAKSKGERAVDAVTAVRNIGRHPAEKRLDVLIAISSLVEQEGLGGIEVDGATVRAHIAATERTLVSPPDDAPAF